MRAFFSIAILLSAALAAPSRADVVVLGDGASFSGNLVRVTDATLVFRTALKGQVMAPMDTVAGITTQNNLAVTFFDESVRYGRLVYQDERQRLLPLDGGTPRTIQPFNIVEALVIPATPSEENGGEDMKAWRSTLGLGLLHKENELSLTQPEARLELSVEQPNVALNADLRAAAGGEHARTLRANLEAEGRREGLSPYAALQALSEPERGLDLRASLTLGVIRPFIDDERGAFRAMAGLNLARESWDNRTIGRGRRATEQDTDLNLRLQLSYTKPLTDEWQVESVLDLLPNLTDWGTFRARSETRLTYAMTARLHLRLDLLLDYDSQPDVAGPNEIGASVGAGIQMSF